MPRAKSTFEKQGFEIIPLNSDYLTSTEPLAWHQYILPSANTFASWDLLIREWVGFVVYKVKGYNEKLHLIAHYSSIELKRREKKETFSLPDQSLKVAFPIIRNSGTGPK
jgi:hypothetical protein